MLAAILLETATLPVVCSCDNRSYVLCKTIFFAGDNQHIKPKPSIAAFANASSTALAVRGDSLEDSGAAPSAEPPAAAASDADNADVSAGITAGQLPAAAEPAMAGQGLQQSAVGHSGSGSGFASGSSGSGSTQRSGSTKAGSSYGGGSSLAAGSGFGAASSASTAADIETWLLLEYCDMGTLQVRVEVEYQ